LHNNIASLKLKTWFLKVWLSLACIRDSLIIPFGRLSFFLVSHAL